MFGNYFYNETIRKTVIAFGTLFNNIKIKKFAADGKAISQIKVPVAYGPCLLYTSPSPRDRQKSRMPSSA